MTKMTIMTLFNETFFKINKKIKKIKNYIYENSL